MSFKLESSPVLFHAHIDTFCHFKWTFKGDLCLWFSLTISCSDDTTLSVTQKETLAQKICLQE